MDILSEVAKGGWLFRHLNKVQMDYLDKDIYLNHGCLASVWYGSLKYLNEFYTQL